MFMQLYYSNFLTLDAGREKIYFQNVLKKTKTQLKMLILNQHDFWECLVWNNPLIFWCWCCCQNPVHPRKGLDLFWKFTVHSSFLILNITLVPRYIRIDCFCRLQIWKLYNSLYIMNLSQKGHSRGQSVSRRQILTD